jgi:hypothetical protein
LDLGGTSEQDPSPKPEIDEAPEPDAGPNLSTNQKPKWKKQTESCQSEIEYDK